MRRVAVADVEQHVHTVQCVGVLLQIIEAEEPHVERRAGKRLNDTRIGIVLFLIERVMYHMAAPCAHLSPAVQNGHGLEAVGRRALYVLIQLSELMTDAFDVVDEVRELARQLQIAAVADAVDGLSEDGAPRRDPVFLRLAHRVAARMERIREEIR